MGVMDVRDAVRAAREKGLDLVEVAPNADPPVCRIIDFGNVPRHAYHTTQTERVWVIIEMHLPSLKAFALHKLSESEA